ncbi:6378_t:CDS:2 [Gigaspora rosea]|nr:6378_t:CDS:2 [Gigaspora rosea]
MTPMCEEGHIEQKELVEEYRYLCPDNKVKMNPEEYQQLKLYLETDSLFQGLNTKRQKKIKFKK